MKRKGFSIGIIFLLLAMVCTTCTKDETLLTPDGENSTLKGAKVESEVFIVYPNGVDDTPIIQQAFNDAIAAGEVDPQTGFGGRQQGIGRTYPEEKYSAGQ